MKGRFNQIYYPFHNVENEGRLKISKLMTLLEGHDYYDQIYKFFKIGSVKDEYIIIDNIDLLFEKISFVKSNFRVFNIKASIADISVDEVMRDVEGVNGNPIEFTFDKYVDEIGENKKNLKAFAIHDAKNSFLDQYDMAKYANRLYRDKLPALAKYNIDYFKSLTKKDPMKNRPRSYRMLEHKSELFLRAITSVKQYNEYGYDFTFVVSMLIFHEVMKENIGNNYTISSAGLSASKLEIIVSEKKLIDAEEFGKISSTIMVTTNDLGSASLKFQNIVKIGVKDQRGFYLFPKNKVNYKNEISISHSFKIDKALEVLRADLYKLSSSNELLNSLKEIKKIKNPFDLKQRISLKIESPRSAFRNIKEVKDLFGANVNNDITNLASLLELCRKAEELDIDYDLKEKIRVIISEIILDRR
ncbi:hypothetical protein [Algoriphagus aquimarinus]|uniref:hypothetical protein n=1 Tax=Algoriphagus aquimarinus TaxID=237018 RepID=UPI0030D9ECEA|tara:strand:+ start:10290 stop:11537 length:1248 start_codon:yes stop_codon:yes gene_type:complete